MTATLIRDIAADDFPVIAASSPALINVSNVAEDDYAATCRKQAEICLIATRAGKLVGHITLDYTFYGNGFVSYLLVSESARRSGVGLALIKEIEGRCRTARLFTSTNQSNAPMRGLLSACGFAESGIIHNLDAGDPEIVYFRSLDSSPG